MATEPTARPVGRPSKYKPSFCTLVQEEMAKGYSLTAFAGLIGVDRDTITEWCEVHSEFSLAVKRAKARRLLQWERAGMSVARAGGSGGQATMIIFGLKNMGGDEWTEKSATTVDGTIKVIHRDETAADEPSSEPLE